FYLVRALPVSHSMAPTAFYSLSLHDALPIFFGVVHLRCFAMQHFVGKTITAVQDIIAEYLTVNLSNHFVGIHVITVEHFAKGDVDVAFLSGNAHGDTLHIFMLFFLIAAAGALVIKRTRLGRIAGVEFVRD